MSTSALNWFAMVMLLAGKVSIAAESDLGAAIANARGAAAVPLLARAKLLSQDPVRELKLSGDGRFIAWRERIQGAMQARIMSVADGQVSTVDGNASETQLYWSPDSRVLWLSDALGLAQFDPASGDARRVHKWAKASEQAWFGIDPNAPDAALISEKHIKGDRREYRYQLLKPGEPPQLILSAERAQYQLLLDSQGQLAYSVGFEGKDYLPVLRRHDASQVRLIRQGPPAARYKMLASDARGLLYIATENQDRSALHRWHLASGQIEVLHRDPLQRADAYSALLEAQGLNWRAMAYDGDRVEWYGRDSGTQAALAWLRSQLPVDRLDLQVSSDGQRWLVSASDSRWVFARHYLYEPKRKQLREVLLRQQPIAPDHLSPAHAFRYRASDGMALQGYLYLPRGLDPARVPLLTMIHGGPFNRDRADYSAFTQMLVNRGYAVFTPNFRGSTGFGLRYTLANRGDLARGRVLADIIEGMDALLTLGIGERVRQAVLGHSFGGYASLLALAHHPDRFRFGLASAAPGDMAWLTQWVGNNDTSALPKDGPPAEQYFARFNVPVKNPQWLSRMRRESPLAHAATLRTPLVLWAGAKDDRVAIQSVTQLAAQVALAGHMPVLMIDPQSGHNPNHAISAHALMHLIEQSAATHLGGKLEPAEAPLGRFIARNLRMGTMR